MSAIVDFHFSRSSSSSPMAKLGCCNLPPAMAFSFPTPLFGTHQRSNSIPPLHFSKSFSSSPLLSNKSLSLPRSRVYKRNQSLMSNGSNRLLEVSALLGGDSETHSEPENNDSGSGATLDIKLPRRSLHVQFNCGKCGETTQRLINRLAYERGLVYVQCAGCEQYHKLADNLGLVVEYDLREEGDGGGQDSDQL